MLRPGGELSARPLDFFWLCDSSGSMSVDGKIKALNNAIRNSLPAMLKVSESNPNASVFIRAVRFSHGADWHISQRVPISEFTWKDLKADKLTNTRGKANADIIFMIDTSGSMSDEIKSVKNSCLDFAERIIKKGANLKLGLIGFDIGGFSGKEKGFEVHNLSTYTIGIWPLTDPKSFKSNIQSLRLSMFGGCGCYLANRDTVDIFSYVKTTFKNSHERHKILVIISDEIGDTSGLSSIISQLNSSNINTYVMGVPKNGKGSHERIAKETGGQFWDIFEHKGKNAFEELLTDVAETIAEEITKTLDNGRVSYGTDMGHALQLVAEQLKIPPMSKRGLPPILVLVSDGKPTDDFEKGLAALLKQPWGKKAVRIAIAIGKEADMNVLQKFIGNSEVKPLQARNSEQLVKCIKWASTVALEAVSSPPSVFTEDSRKSYKSVLDLVNRRIDLESFNKEVW